MKLKYFLLKIFCTVTFICLQLFSFAQTDTARLRISLITCSAGNELYSIFGHTAIRIIDSTYNSDLVYNYGTFDFNDPDFYSKFVRGKLDYFLSVERTSDFLPSYASEGRSVFEQVLLLSKEQKNKIQQSLINNLSGSNKFYKYDFLFDNCTTRARDVLMKNSTFTTNWQIVSSNTTFRKMLYEYLDNGGACWSKLGIDILLGSNIDVSPTMHQATFLPDYLMHSLDSCNRKNTIIQERFDYKADLPTTEKNNHLPILIFSVWTVVVALWSYIKNRIVNKLFCYYAVFITFITGLLGCLLLFMWFGTDHKSCANNYNILWALPTNVIAVFFAMRKSTIVKRYFMVLLFLTCLLIVFWFAIPQQFNLALFPFTVHLLFCYKALWLYNKNNKNKTTS